MSVIKVSSKSGSATRGAQKTIRVELQGGTQTHDIIPFHHPLELIRITRVVGNR